MAGAPQASASRGDASGAMTAASSSSSETGSTPSSALRPSAQQHHIHIYTQMANQPCATHQGACLNGQPLTRARLPRSPKSRGPYARNQT